MMRGLKYADWMTLDFHQYVGKMTIFGAAVHQAGQGARKFDALARTGNRAAACGLGLAMRKILIMGLPGAGKTTLARRLAPLLGAPLFNADEVRANVSRDLGFSLEDRIEHARRMGWLCDRVVEAGGHAIADFVCPTEATRAAFGPTFVVWVDRIEAGRFEDTNRLFQPPRRHDVRVVAEGSVEAWTEIVAARIRGV
jgi:hypothetical protein